MMFAKMAFHNIKNRMHDHLIYLLTLTALAAMMLSAFMLPIFPALSENDSGVFMANSLPALIALTMLFLMVYINRFMLKRRSREFAIYALSGIPKNKICLLYFGEHLLSGLFALVMGLFFGLLVFWLILTLFSASWTIKNILFAALQTCVYFIISHTLSLVLTVFHIRKLNIKNLLDFHKDNEHGKWSISHLILLSIITIAAFPVYLYQIKHFNPFTASTLVFIFGIILYGSYSSIFGWLTWYRKSRGNFLYHSNRLFIVGQLLSKIRTMIRMSIVISGCLLIAMCSFVTGWIFAGNETVLIGDENNLIMGFAQFYISILFTIVVFSIIALQQIVDNREHNQKFIILNQLGTDFETLNRTLLKQVFLNFTIPVFMAVILMLCSLHPLAQIINPLLDKEHLFIQGISIYMGIFTFLYTSYMAATYISLRKVKYV